MTRWKGKLSDKVARMVINPDGHTLAEHEKRSKYHSVKTVVNGITFDSKKEAGYYTELLLSFKYGDVTHIERQVKYPYIATYTRNDVEWANKSFTKRGFYRADFVVTYKDGHTECVDVKGILTKEFKQKRRIIEALYEIKIKIV